VQDSMNSTYQDVIGGQLPARAHEEIDPATRLGVVTLRVADLDRSIRFYQEVIGLRLAGRDGDSATLGVDGAGLLVLRALPGARPVPQRATGLFHVAILLPSQADLGHALQRMIAASVPVGQGDHLVSEALYLSDPDGNGIEVYRDRPRSEWRWEGGQVHMATDPVDLRGLLLAAERAGTPGADAPAGTTIGHVHLKVADLGQARAFFHDLLGFNVIAQMPGALFVSAGGYHHHFGLNTWQSRGAAPTPEGAAGLVSYTIVLPDAEALARVLARLDAGTVAYTREAGQMLLRDPWDNQLVLAIEPASLDSSAA
jgi:catechol 2,3-dioxygenase